MKIALIADTHFGIRGDAQMMLDYQQKFFDNVFFPYLKANKIHKVIHLGDLVDRRKYINFNTARRMREMFLEKFHNNSGLFCDIIIGNHDVAYKNTNDLNALDEMVGLRYDNINIYTKPKNVIQFDEAHAAAEYTYIPWITADNREETFELLNKTKTQIAFGHLELQGFLNNDGVASEFGDDPKLFQKFDQVFTGHYHTRIAKENILYVGCPYQMTWADYANDKGFHIFDTETRKVEFIKNPHQLFTKLNYNDDKHNLEQLKKQVKESDVKDAYVKIIIEEKTDPYTFDRYLAHIEKLAPFDLKVVESKSLMLYDTDISQAEDTLTILKKSIPLLDVAVDKEELERVVVDLFKRANQIELQ